MSDMKPSPTSTPTGAPAVPLSAVGQPGGVASLGSDGKVPAGQINSAAYQALGATPGTAKTPARRVTTKIVDFGTAGHGWTANSNVASSNVNDTTDFVRGTQSAKLTTKGDTTVASIRNTAMTSVNLTGKALEVSIKMDDWTHVGSLLLYVGDTAFANFRVLTLWSNTLGQASGVSIKPADNGEWVTFTTDLSNVTGTTGAPNIAAVTSMQIAVQDDGTAVTMHTNHISSFPAVTSAYPNGVVSFTFDDSLATQWSVGRAALDKYGWQGTFYTITGALGTAGCMTLTQLQQMHEVSGHEVAAHASSVAAHNQVGGYTALSQADLDTELRALKKWEVDNGFTRGRDHFAYPQGLRNLTTEAVVKSYFSSARGVLATVETSNPGNLYRLRTIKANTPVTLATVKAAVDAATATGSWLIITVHDLPASVPSGSGNVEWLAQDFRDLVDYVATKAIAVRSIGDALATL